MAIKTKSVSMVDLMAGPNIDPAFGLHLKALLAMKGLSLSGFSRAIGQDPSHIFRITRAERLAPEDGLEAWAKVLGLTQSETDVFIETALLSHCPKRIRDKFRAMNDQISRKLP